MKAQYGGREEHAKATVGFVKDFPHLSWGASTRAVVEASLT